MAVAGILLTGGSSRRMGVDKATLDHDGTTLSRRAAAVLATVAAPLVEVGPGVSGLVAVQEDPPLKGPLVAIVCGLDALQIESHVLVMACDLPAVTTGLLRWLVEHPWAGSVVPLVAGRAQPLCARWSPTAQQSMRDLTAAGERSLRPVVGGADVHLADEREWSVVADAAAWRDVDTPADLERLTDP